MIRRVRSSLLRLPRLPSKLAFHLPAGLVLLLAACDATSDTTTTTAIFPTSLTVDPRTFLGSVVCSNLPGALHSYVATLTQTPKNGPSVTLASSPPTPCSQSVSFRYVKNGLEYTVAIDGYEAPASSLVPCGGPESGSRYMLPAPATPNLACADALTAGAVPVAPRWHNGCGNVASKPVTDVDVVATCDGVFNDSGTTAPAAVTVKPSASLGMLACFADGGTISRFDIKADDANQNNYLGLPCESDPEKTYTDLVPGATYTFQIAAHDVGELPVGPRFTATCSAVARAGFTVPADCAPFSQP